nr:MAG TPA: hypothetical protein [Caudoviricetes sp.]DAO91354.1 MAG TPA: hypothetical protein [Caudoviricetes sp.]DAQ60193.1 MAG TPA: hypothetical protein [Caudoviricetes sp.]
MGSVPELLPLGNSFLVMYQIRLKPKVTIQ